MGLERRHVTAGGYDMPYLEAGPTDETGPARAPGDPVVLVHGFSDSSETWVESAGRLRRQHRVIAPDLPGHGLASSPGDHPYSVGSQAARLVAFLDALGLERVHLVGNSMGGAISAHLTLDHPHRVRSLTLIGAAGVAMPIASTLQQELDEGRNPFSVSTHDEYDEFLGFVVEKRPWIPSGVRAYLAEEYIRRQALNRKILDDLLDEELDLTPRLGDLRAPTLALWGNLDRLIDLSAGRVYHAEIPDARLVILHGIGHCPQVETPGRTAALLRRHFRASADV